MSAKPAGPSSSAAARRRLGDVRGVKATLFATGLIVAVLGAGLAVGSLFGGSGGVLGLLALLGGALLAVSERLEKLTLKRGIAALFVVLISIPAIAVASVTFTGSGLKRLIGDLTFAFIPFSIEHLDNAKDDNELGGQIASSLQDQLQVRLESSLLEEHALTMATDVYNADLDSPETGEGDQAAAAWAQSVNADFVVGGRITVGRTSSRLSLHLFISPLRVPNAPELAGWHAAAPVDRAADVRTSTAALGDMYAELGRSLDTLIDVGLALEDLAAADPVEAEEGLTGVLADGGFSIVPEHLVYLFLGNAIGRVSCAGSVCEEVGLQRAADAFESALAIEAASIRPRIGLSELALLRAQGGCQPSSPPDEQLLQEAERAYQAVLAEEVSDVPAARARLGLARAQHCRVRADISIDDSLVVSTAHDLQTRSQDNALLVAIAAEAQGLLGTTAAHLGRTTESVAAYEAAVRLAEAAGDAPRLALWLSLLGDAARLPPCNLSLAQTSYERSIEQYRLLLLSAAGAAKQRLQAELDETLSQVAAPTQRC